MVWENVMLLENSTEANMLSDHQLSHVHFHSQLGLSFSSFHVEVFTAKE